MTPERKAKWLADLRSGQYAKTKSYLRASDRTDAGTPGTGYCCLGVLLDTEVGFDDRGKPNYLNGQNLHEGQELSQYGLQHFDISKDDADALMGLNDTNNSFEPACVYIEEKL